MPVLELAMLEETAAKLWDLGLAPTSTELSGKSALAVARGQLFEARAAPGCFQSPVVRRGARAVGWGAEGERGKWGEQVCVVPILQRLGAGVHPWADNLGSK